MKLGASRASEHYLYRHHSDRGKQYEDFFCLTPIGVRVGYGSPKLLKILTTKQRKALEGSGGVGVDVESVLFDRWGPRG